MAKRNNKSSNSSNRNKKLLVLIGFVVFIFLVMFLLKQGEIDTFQRSSQIIIPTVMPTPSIREYHSEFLKIRFMAPSEFEISESWNSVALENKIGKMNIASSGTNNDSIEAVVFELEDRGFLVTNKKKFEINGLDVISCNVKSLARDGYEIKGYYFYSSPGNVFVITTSTPELFDELDQIARSFRYEP